MRGENACADLGRAARAPDDAAPVASTDIAPTLDDIPTFAADPPVDSGPEPATCPHTPTQPASTASHRGPNSTVARLVLSRVASP